MIIGSKFIIELNKILKLINLVEKTQDYYLKKGILQYLMSLFHEDKDYIESLQYSKMLFVETKTQFDEELAAVAAEYILQNLSYLE